MVCYKETTAFSSLLKSEDFSDLKIICGDRTFNVHRAIVCPQSEFLMAACRGQFKEAKTRTIKLTGDDPSTIASLIDCFYNSTYRDASFQGESEEYPHTLQKILGHIAIYVVADKYLAEEIKGFAAQYFEAWCSNEWVDDWTLHLPDVVRAVYRATRSSDRTLRDSLVRVIVSEGMDESPQVDKEEYNAVLVEIPDAKTDILTEKVAQGQREIKRLKEDKKALACENQTLKKGKAGLRMRISGPL